MTLPDSRLLDTVTAAVRGLVAERSTHPAIVGLCGAQGSGKSTLARAVAVRLESEGHRAAILSIDDLYLTRGERLRLARDVHPLLATRGPPGTHDIALGYGVIEALRLGRACPLPRFDKARDDRLPARDWPMAPADCSVLILEGWCVGARPQTAAALREPVNALEANEDPRCVWRTYVNDALAGPYRLLFDAIDYLIFLAAPDFDIVARWRAQQENDLRARSASEGTHVMTRAQLVRFIQHYERLTRHMLEEMPDRADMVVSLDGERGADHIVLQADHGGT